MSRSDYLSDEERKEVHIAMQVVAFVTIMYRLENQTIGTKINS